MIKSALRLVLLLACFGGGVALGGALLTLFFPAVEAGGVVQQKLMHLAAGRDRYDMLFLGSSRTYRQIDPEVFDRVAGELGRPTRSFNFGVNGMFAPEDSYVCEQMLKARPSRLHWVLLEVGYFLPSNIADPVQPQRVIVWHDWRRTLAACRAIIPPSKPVKGHSLSKRFEAWQRRWDALAKVWPQIQGHLRCFALRQSGLGRAAEALRAQLGSPTATPAAHDPRIGARAGFSSIDDVPAPALIALFEQEFAARQINPPNHVPLPPEGQRNLDRILGLVRAAGAQPVLFHAPATPEMVYVPDPKSHVPVIDFSDYKKYPDLFKAENRYDRAHLNAKGAAIFSRLIGQEWVAALNTKK